MDRNVKNIRSEMNNNNDISVLQNFAFCNFTLRERDKWRKKCRIKQNQVVSNI